MIRTWVDWIWRCAVLAALCWVGFELQGLRNDLAQPADDTNTAAADPNALQDSVDALRDDMAEVKQKVDAMLIVMARQR